MHSEVPLLCQNVSLSLSSEHLLKGRKPVIPASFEYHRPKDMAGVLSILQENGDDASVMAGGHSLIPMMKLRMADVPHLIDLQDVGGLAGITVGDNHHWRHGHPIRHHFA